MLHFASSSLVITLKNYADHAEVCSSYACTVEWLRGYLFAQPGANGLFTAEMAIRLNESPLKGQNKHQIHLQN